MKNLSKQVTISKLCWEFFRFCRNNACILINATQTNHSYRTCFVLTNSLPKLVIIVYPFTQYIRHLVTMVKSLFLKPDNVDASCCCQGYTSACATVVRSPSYKGTMASVEIPGQRRRWGNESTNFYHHSRTPNPGVPTRQKIYRCDDSQYTNCGHQHVGTKSLNS